MRIPTLVLVALAIQAAPSRAAGDAAAGKTKSLACQACHISARADSSAPRLVAQREGYLVAQLTAFKAGDRKHSLMNPIAKQLTDADIADLAAYWSSQPAGSDATVPPAVAAIRRPRMEFPRDFPNGFVVYHTANDTDQKTVTKSYANQAAAAAARAHKPLPDGSAIMVVTYPARLDAAKKPIVEKDGAWAVDAPTAFSGMEARAGWGKDVPPLLRNGNWSYNLFDAARAPRADVNQAACLACHKPAESTSYVFTLHELEGKPAAK